MSSVQIDTYTIIDGTGKPIEVALMDVFEKDGIQYASVSEIIEDEIQDDLYIYRCQNEGMDMTFEEIKSDEEFNEVVKYYMSFYGFD
ncbi:MAG: DUF1292 domain-containing protein [Floccifex porci]|uniref:DUF1292 domain-containing protein n=1 Tax=Floccifex porci TaxID=2606629 RepID=A0A7X2T3D3_9FIRM|nr:DUF1292 domain-containing protein [Floccifex porci]MDD7467165.1 DUF1292 domain-containing protein [Floccifex porci]MDY4796949.1 DUF1292 domain-containing protein [Floccifex porci]MSS01459.1 DUF1292 domain-containing protein [Floccifex porci]